MSLLQQDFGAFDPRFLGITLRIDGERSWLRMLTILGGGATEADDYEHIRDPDERLEVVLANTVIAHELRHFHDFLLTPVSGVVMRNRVMARLNTIQFLVLNLQWEDANCIPVPLSRWCGLSLAERQAYLDHLNAWRGAAAPPLVAPDLPVVVPDEEVLEVRSRVIKALTGGVAEQIRVIARCYRQLEAILAPHDSGGGARPFLPMHVSELPAILVQIQDAWTGLGVDATARLLDAFVSQSSRYGVPRDVLTLYQQSRLSAKLLSAAATWAMCGTWPNGADDKSSVSRFADVSIHLRQHHLPSPDASVAELFARWDDDLSDESTLDGMAHDLERDTAFLARLGEIAELVKKSDVLLRDLLAEETLNTRDYYAAFSRARRQCVEQFLRAPDDYIEPARYLEMAFHQLPSPMVAVEFRSVSAPRADELERDGWYVHLSRQMSDGGTLATIVGPPVQLPGIEFFDREQVFGEMAHQIVADVLFSPMRWDRDDWDVALAESALGERHSVIRLQL